MAIPQCQLPPELDRLNLPQHIAVIMDGNGRWAQQRGLPRIAGHRRGAEVLKELLRCCKDWGISALTAYAFSTENWQRPAQEVHFLMRLFERLLRQELADMHQAGVRLSIAGDLSSLPHPLQAAIQRSVDQTRHNQAVHLTVAINYGGRQEILYACRQLAQQVQYQTLAPSDIDEQRFEQQLYTANTAHPDLLIRTSGEMRISNFLLWQIAHTEIYVTDTLWPDFDRETLQHALIAYQQRDRFYSHGDDAIGWVENPQTQP